MARKASDRIEVDARVRIVARIARARGECNCARAALECVLQRSVVLRAKQVFSRLTFRERKGVALYVIVIACYVATRSHEPEVRYIVVRRTARNSTNVDGKHWRMQHQPKPRAEARIRTRHFCSSLKLESGTYPGRLYHHKYEYVVGA